MSINMRVGGICRTSIVALAAATMLPACVVRQPRVPPSTPVPPPIVSTPAPAAPVNAPTRARRASAADALVLSAVSLVGTPYRYGGNSPGTGFDCSGLVVYLMAQQDVGMPRTVQEQFRVGTSVARDRLRPGDLVFFTTTGPGATHVGIVIDADGTQFMHAPTNGSVVRIDRLDADYWRQRWVGAKRVL